MQDEMSGGKAYSKNIVSPIHSLVLCRKSVEGGEISKGAPVMEDTETMVQSFDIKSDAEQVTLVGEQDVDTEPCAWYTLLHDFETNGLSDVKIFGHRWVPLVLCASTHVQIRHPCLYNI